MPELLQTVLDLVSAWGTGALAAVALIALLGGVRRWRAHPTLATGARLRKIGTSWWPLAFVFAVAGLYLLNVQLGPMTGALATLQAARGEEAPDLAFRSLADGAPRKLSDYRGSVVVLNLWATWCPPCLEELPILDRLQGSYRDRGLVVIALSDESPERLASYFEQRPAARLLTAYAGSFGWLEIADFRPFTLIIDRQGVLRRHVLGTRSYDEFERVIRPYL